MSHQSFPKATGSITDGYVLTYVASDGYWAPRASAYPGWKTVYDVDFSTLGTQSFSSDGNVTIDGKTWTVVNKANATAIGVINGTGLQISCNTNSSDYNNGARTAPLLTTKIRNIYPTFDLYSQRIRISLYFSHNADQTYESVGFGFEDNSNPINYMTAILRQFGNSGNQFNSKYTIDGTSTENADTNSTSDNVMQVTLNNLTNIETKTGVYSGGFPIQEDYRSRRAYAINNFTPAVNNSDDINIVFYALTANNSGTLVGTAIRMKIEVYTSDAAQAASGIVTTNITDSSAQFTTVLDNVAGNGTYPTTVSTNWSNTYTADGYSKVIIIGSAQGGMSTSGAQIHLNLKVDGATVKTVSRYSNTNGIHVQFPTLFYTTILSPGNHTLELLQSGTNSFNDNNDFATLWVYKVANVTNLGWASTKTSNFTAATSDTYIPVDTTSGAVTITLPASPDNGERHIIADVGGNAATNNITVNGNGHNIIGASTYVMTGPYNTLEVAYHSDKAIWVII